MFFWWTFLFNKQHQVCSKIRNWLAKRWEHFGLFACKRIAFGAMLNFDSKANGYIWWTNADWSQHLIDSPLCCRAIVVCVYVRTYKRLVPSLNVTTCKFKLTQLGQRFGKLSRHDLATCVSEMAPNCTLNGRCFKSSKRVFNSVSKLTPMQTESDTATDSRVTNSASSHVVVVFALTLSSNTNVFISLVKTKYKETQCRKTWLWTVGI